MKELFELIAEHPLVSIFLVLSIGEGLRMILNTIYYILVLFKNKKEMKQIQWTTIEKPIKTCKIVWLLIWEKPRFTN